MCVHDQCFHFEKKFPFTKNFRTFEGRKGKKEKTRKNPQKGENRVKKLLFFK